MRRETIVLSDTENTKPTAWKIRSDRLPIAKQTCVSRDSISYIPT